MLTCIGALVFPTAAQRGYSHHSQIEMRGNGEHRPLSRWPPPIEDVVERDGVRYGSLDKPTGGGS